MANHYEIVPGMAEAIEQRRVEKGLSPSEFAEAAGLTREGARPVRLGQRRRYQDKVRLGIARALDWPEDALDRLMEGQDPATFETRPSSAITEADERLSRVEAQLKELQDMVKEMNDRAQDRSASANHRP